MLRIPRSFLDMPRWWTEGADWLAALPDTARAACERWNLEPDGDPAHGSNALVLPVRRAGTPLALRLTPPGPDVAAQVAALRFWAGRGVVLLVDADEAAGAMVLERLEVSGSLLTAPVEEAMHVLGTMMRRLAVPVSLPVPSTRHVVAGRLAHLEADWRRLGEPFDEALLRAATAAGARVSDGPSSEAVNGDLHSAQVLRGTRERWLTVDSVLMRGDRAYDLARVLWTRLDEMPDRAAIRHHFETAADAAGVSHDRARDWVLYRTVDYWLWGLGAGLTEDPERCDRLTEAMRA